MSGTGRTGGATSLTTIGLHKAVFDLTLDKLVLPEAART
jgi:hypothetical protein